MHHTQFAHLPSARRAQRGGAVPARRGRHPPHPRRLCRRPLGRRLLSSSNKDAHLYTKCMVREHGGGAPGRPPPLCLASPADQERGTPFAVLARPDGQILPLTHPVGVSPPPRSRLGPAITTRIERRARAWRGGKGVGCPSFQRCPQDRARRVLARGAAFPPLWERSRAPPPRSRRGSAFWNSWSGERRGGGQLSMARPARPPWEKRRCPHPFFGTFGHDDLGMNLLGPRVPSMHTVWLIDGASVCSPEAHVGHFCLLPAAHRREHAGGRAGVRAC
eukprot:gene23139-biopygen11802